MTMTDWFAALQPAVVGAVLAWAGGGKLFGRRAAALARRTALARLTGPDRAVPAYRAVGSAELGIGAVLLLPPALAGETALAAVLCAGLLGYLGYARVAAPDAPCGCLSARPTPVRWRGFARATALAAACVLSTAAAMIGAVAGLPWWGAAVADRPLAAVAVLVAELAVLLALSPELDTHWLLPLRRLRLRWSHPLAASATGAGAGAVPMAGTLQQLLRSPAYQVAGGWLRSDVLDTWDDGEWRVLSYSANHGDRPATAVFAVPLRRYQPAAVRAVLVDEPGQGVLWEFAPQPVPV
jgi:hypothetical protein